MANNNFVVSLLINAKDRASGALGVLRRGLLGLDNTATRLAASLGTLFGAYSAGRLFAGAIGSAASLEEQLSRVQAATGATQDDMGKLRAAAEEMGASTRYTATQSAEALEVLGRAGLDAASSVEALPTVMKLAQADGIELATAAGLITDSLGAMGEGVDQAARFADVLAQGARLANTNVTQLGHALSYTGVQAAQMGLSVEDTVALLDALASAGIRGERAGTAMRNILSQLADPASKARKELRALGLDTSDLGEVIAGLEAQGARGEQAILAFGTEAGPALRTLLQVGSAGIAEYRKGLDDAAGTVEDMAATMDRNLRGALRGLGSAWDALRVKLVDPLLEPIAAEVNALAQGLRDFASSQALQDFSGALVAAFRDAAAGARDWLGSMDFAQATADLGEFVRTAVERFGTITQAVAITAAGLRTVINGFTAGVNVFGAFVAKTAESALWYAEKYAGALRVIGLASDEAVGKVANMRQAFADASRDYVDQVVQDGEDIRAALDDLAAALDKPQEKQREAAAEAARANDSWRGSIEEVAAAAEAAVPTLERVAGQVAAAIEAAGDTAALQAARGALDELYAAGRIGAEQYAEGLERVAERAQALRAASEAGQKSLDQAGITFGRTALQAEELDEALERVGISVKEAVDPEDVRAAEQALRQMFREGRIDAEELSRALDELHGRTREQGAAAQEAAAETEAAAERMRQAFDQALREASSGGDIIRLRQQLEEAWRAGVISAEEYRERLKDIRAATKALAEETSAAGNLISSIFNATSKAAYGLSRATGNYFRELMGLSGGVGTELEALQQRLRGVNERIRESRGQMLNLAGGIGTYIEKLADAGRQAERAFLEQAVAAETLRQRVESGRLSTAELERAARRAERGFDLLDQQQLTGLRSAIAAAQRDAQQLTDSLEQQVSSLRDELDQLRGDEEAIEQRRFDRQRQEIEEQLALAQAQGNREAAQEAQEALRLLQQIQSERREQQRQQQAQQRQQQTQPTTPTPAPARAAAPPTQRLEFVAPSGRVVAGEFTEDNAAQMVELLAEAGMRTV